MKKYQIEVTPSIEAFKTHIWQAGNKFTLNEAKGYVKQLKKLKSIHDGRKNFYKSVKII